MDSLLKEFQSGSVKAVGYADNIIVMASGIDMRISAENIQLALNKIINWRKAKGLVFNPSKTQAIIFDRPKKYKVSPQLWWTDKSWNSRTISNISVWLYNLGFLGPPTCLGRSRRPIWSWATPPPPMIKSCHLQAFFLNTYKDCCDVYYNSTKKKEAMSTPIKYTKFWLK